MTDARRSGFTVIELLITAVLGAALLSAAMKVFMSEHAVYTARDAHMEGRQTVRVGLEVLANELREVSPADGDIVAMSSRSITVRTPLTLGFACETVTGVTPGLKMIVTGDWLQAGDSVLVFAETDAATAADDSWLIAMPSSSDTTQTCGSDTAQFLELPSLSDALDTDSVRVGAPVRGFRHRTYSLGSVGGEPYLVRSGPQESALPLVGPLQDTVGVAFEYLDIDDVATNTAADVSFIRLTLRTFPGVEEVTREPVQDAMTVLVAPRN